MYVCMCALHVSQMLYVSGLSHERKLLVLYLFVRGSTRLCQKVSDSVLCGFHNFSTNYIGAVQLVWTVQGEIKILCMSLILDLNEQ